MVGTKILADALTGLRFVLGFCLVWLGWQQGPEAIATAALLLLIAWTSDTLDGPLAREFALALRRLPHLIMIPLDDTLAHQATIVAAQYRLRGSDTVYAAVALRFGSILVTLDREQRERVSAALTARYPSEVLPQVG